MLALLDRLARAVGIAALLGSGGLLALALLPLPAKLVCKQNCSTLDLVLVAVMEAVLFSLFVAGAGKLLQRWYWRVLVMLLLLVAWEPIQHTLVVHL